MDSSACYISDFERENDTLRTEILWYCLLVVYSKRELKLSRTWDSFATLNLNCLWFCNNVTQTYRQPNVSNKLMHICSGTKSSLKHEGKRSPVPERSGKTLMVFHSCFTLATWYSLHNTSQKQLINPTLSRLLTMDRTDCISQGRLSGKYKKVYRMIYYHDA